MPGAQWSQQDEDYLTRYYLRYSDLDLSIKLGRTVEAIQRKRMRSGLDRPLAPPKNKKSPVSRKTLDWWEIFAEKGDFYDKYMSKLKIGVPKKPKLSWFGRSQGKKTAKKVL